jgi:hypothetical protein
MTVARAGCSYFVCTKAHAWVGSNCRLCFVAMRIFPFFLCPDTECRTRDSPLVFLEGINYNQTWWQCIPLYDTNTRVFHRKPEISIGFISPDLTWRIFNSDFTLHFQVYTLPNNTCHYTNATAHRCQKGYLLRSSTSVRKMALVEKR